MRIALIILIGIHGLIHLFGFFKAFGIAEFSAISQPISKISGLFWLATFLLFVVTLILIVIRSDYYWVYGFIATITSQILIVRYWSDAKFGTTANLIILFATIIAYANFNFKNIIKKESSELLNRSENIENRNIDKDDISTLPTVIQSWLKHSGVVGKPIIENVSLTQELELKLKPEQQGWKKGSAEQYFTIQPPAFNWNLNAKMNTLLNIAGRDKFENGNGEMLIKLQSLISIIDVKNNKKVNQATLQRYLAEIVWFPSAALSNYIKWEEIDENSARATMKFNDTKGTGIFYFDKKGQFKKFVAMRFKDPNDNEPTEWTVIASKTEERNGIKIPTECEASWNMKSGQWTWLKLRIKHIEYNVKNDRPQRVDLQHKSR